MATNAHVSVCLYTWPWRPINIPVITKIRGGTGWDHPGTLEARVRAQVCSWRSCLTYAMFFVTYATITICGNQLPVGRAVLCRQIVRFITHNLSWHRTALATQLAIIIVMWYYNSITIIVSPKCFLMAASSLKTRLQQFFLFLIAITGNWKLNPWYCRLAS